jgi:hypothetical protein
LVKHDLFTERSMSVESTLHQACIQETFAYLFSKHDVCSILLYDDE